MAATLSPSSSISLSLWPPILLPPPPTLELGLPLPTPPKLEFDIFDPILDPVCDALFDVLFDIFDMFDPVKLASLVSPFPLTLPSCLLVFPGVSITPEALGRCEGLPTAPGHWREGQAHLSCVVVCAL